MFFIILNLRDTYQSVQFIQTLTKPLLSYVMTKTSYVSSIYIIDKAIDMTFYYFQLYIYNNINSHIQNTETL